MQNEPVPKTQQRDADANVLQTANYGGLNTVSSRLNIPLEDSPSMANTQVTVMGSIAKRKGSKSRYQATGKTYAIGSTLVPITLRNDVRCLLCKEGKDLTFYAIENDVPTLLMTKSNVWPTVAATVRANYVATSEVNPRVIFVTGVAVPIQATIVEVSGTGGSGSCAISDTRLEYATTSNTVVWVNGTRISVTSMSYASGTLTITDSEITSGSEVVLLLLTWQWYAEALKLWGYNCYDKTSKFYLTLDDQNVAISTDISRDIQPYQWGYYPIKVYKSATYGDTFTFKTDFAPTTYNEYNFSSGGVYTKAASTDIVQPGISYITFGALKTPTTTPPDPVHFVRGYKLNFNGGDGCTASNLLVRVDDTTYTQNTNASAGSGTPTSSPTYYLRDSTYAVVTGTTTLGTFVSFDSMTSVGIASTAFVEIINKEVGSYVGTGATSNFRQFDDGALYPAYGLGNVADYKRGSFPRTVALFQNRLVFGGYPTAPMQLTFSGVEDTAKPGWFYNNFQTTVESTSSVSAIDVTLSNTLDDLITAMVEYQNQLFVFTRKAFYRISGGESGTITALNLLTSFVAELGCANGLSVVRASSSAMFLSSSGVFDVIPVQESNDYSAGERSVKIRNLLTSDKCLYNESCSWLAYDPTKEEVYVAVSSNVQSYFADRLFVYSMARDAWTEYQLGSGMFPSIHGVASVTSSNDTDMLILSPIATSFSSAPSRVQILEMNSERYIDEEEEYTVQSGDVSGFSIVTDIPYRQVSYTTQPFRFEYPTSVLDSEQATGFTLLDVPVEDVEVTLGTRTLEYGTDFVKTHNSDIYLLIDPGSSTLTATHKIDGAHPIAVYADNVRLTEGTDYTVSKDTGTGMYKITFTSGTQHAVIRWGSLYPTYHFSPFFIRGSLAKLKGMREYIGYFTNKGTQYFLPGDENTNSSQSYEQLSGLYKVKYGFNLAILYNDQYTGHESYDLYGFDELYWDVGVFDHRNPSAQFYPHARIIEPLVGSNYGFEVCIWSFDDTYFEMVGYQILCNSSKEGYGLQ